MYKSVFTVALALSFACGIAFGQENTEVRDQAERMREEARRIEERARAQSEQLREQSRRLMEQAERSQRVDERERERASTEASLERAEAHANVKALEQKLQALRSLQAQQPEDEGARSTVAEGDKELQRARMRLEELAARGDRPTPERRAPQGGDVGTQRLRHLRVAAENLRAAGMNDLAQMVMQRAAAMERELGEARDPQRPVQRGGADRGEIDALRRELQQLREEVRRMRAERGSDRSERPGQPAPGRPGRSN